MIDEPRPPSGGENGDADDGGDAGEAPPPATWAGRERAGGGPGERGEDAGRAGGEDEPPEDDAAGDDDPREDDPHDGGEDAPPEDDGPREGGEGWGFTDAFDAAEREPGESLDDEGGEEVAGGEGDSVEPEVADSSAAGEGHSAEAENGDSMEPDEGHAVEAGDGGDGAPGQETIESDTLALADREEAEEAALAGLRARAGGGAADAAPVVPGPATAAGAAAGAGDGDSTDESDAAEAGEPEPAPAAVAATADDEKPPKRRALWPRFLAACVVIVASVATATSVSLLIVLTDLARGIDPIPNVAKDLDPAEGGDPQTILILGSDERRGVEAHLGARSDTTIVLRVDPDRGAIALLSIPRDLKVDFNELGIDGLGTGKFNAAYSEGGPEDTLKAVKNLLGIDVNHVVNINFTGFADAVNAIDCVYIDVDRRYYVPEGLGYAAIDPPIEAGYQRLCGLKALQYVRFRRDDNDLVRAARQQDFLREARAKVTTSRLIEDRQELIDIFTEYTSSDEDLRDPIQLFELLKTFNSAASAPVNEVHFPARLGGANQPYVTARAPEIQAAVDQLMGTQGTPGPQRGSGSKKRKQRRDGDRSQGDASQSQSAPESESTAESGEGSEPMVDASGLADVARLVADQTSPSGRRVILEFPVFFPDKVPADTSFEATGWSRAFPIDGPGDDVYEGYKIVLGTPGASGLTEHWGISGTNWRDPPILENPSETRTINGREYLLFFDGDRLRLVGWKKGQRSYWVSNTLLQTLEEEEMLATAQAMRSLER